MEIWTELRRRVLTGEISRRQAAREYGYSFRTIAKVCVTISHPPAPEDTLLCSLILVKRR